MRLLSIICAILSLLPAIGQEETRNFPLGPIGGQFRVTPNSSYARIVALDATAPGITAGLQVGDYVYGAFGKTFTPTGSDHYGVTQELGFAVDRAEASDGTLPLLVLRPGTGGITINVALSAAGAFGPAYPRNSAKYAGMYETAVADLHSRAMNSNGSMGYLTGFTGLCLLGHPNWNDTTGAKPYRLSINKIRDFIVGQITNGGYAPTEKKLIDGSAIPNPSGGLSNWQLGQMLMFLSEYYVKTSDSSVAGSLQRGAEMCANSVQWWKQPAEHSNGFSPEYSQVAGMSSHSGVTGDYMHLGSYCGINSAGVHSLNGLAFARSAGVDMNVRPKDGHYFGFNVNPGDPIPAGIANALPSSITLPQYAADPDRGSVIENTSSPLNRSDASDPFFYNPSLAQKFLMQMNFICRRSLNSGGSVRYAPESGDDADCVRTTGALLGMAMYQKDVGGLDGADLNRLESMKQRITTNYMAQQKSHVLNMFVAGQAFQAFCTPFLSERQQRFSLDNWRFYYALSRTADNGICIFPGRNVDEYSGYLDLNHSALISIALPYGIANGGYSLIPAYNNTPDQVIANFQSPDITWPTIEARKITHFGGTLAMPVSLVDGQGAEVSSGYTASWTKVSGPGTVNFSQPSAITTGITFSASGNYRIQLTVNRGGYTLVEPIDISVNFHSPPAGYLAGMANYQVYTDIPGTTLADLEGAAKFPDSPDIELTVTSLAGTHIGDNYGARLSGCLIAPVTGSYRFYIASDDSSQLKFNSGGLAAPTEVIASVSGATGVNQWNKFGSQRSAVFNLTAGQAYAFEVLHKEGTGGDHVSVGWSIDDGAIQVIEGAYLAVPPPAEAPAMSIVAHPQSASSALGGSVTLSLVATGPQPSFYQWRRNGVNVGAATNSPTITFANVSGGAEGSYDCVYTTALGSLTSNAAQVTVTDAGNLVSGGLWREVYTGIGGGAVTDLTTHDKFPFNADSSGPITSAAAPDNYGDNYGQRITGWIRPTVSGNYRFYLTSDDSSELWLGTNELPASKTRILQFTGYTGHMAWSTRAPSAYIELHAGKSYYIEILHKEAGGGDHCSVAWQREGEPAPVNGSGEIPGGYLSYRAGGSFDDVPGPGNQPPSFVSNPVAMPDAYLGFPYTDQSLDSVAGDFNSADLLVFSKLDGPAWLSVANNGELSGNPTAADFGVNRFTVRVTDPGGLTNTATLNINVVNLPATSIWTHAGGGAWPVSGNWLRGNVATGTDQTADFSTLNLTSDVTVTLDGDRTSGHLRFGDVIPSHNWTLATGSGGSLTLATSAGTPSIEVGPPNVTISAALAGSQGLIKTGAGTLVLTGANTYSGGTTISGGAITVGSPTALGSGVISITDNAGIINTNGFSNPIVIAGTNTLTLGGGFTTVSGAISGTGNLRVNSHVCLNGANTFTGNFTGAGGYITIANDAALGASGNTITFTGGSISTYRAPGPVNLSRNITITNGIGLDVNGGSLTLTGVISGTGGFRTIAGGPITLTGNNTYSGSTNINAGTFSINSIKNINGGASALGAVTTAVGGTIGLGSGTLKYIGTGNVTDRVINLSSATGTPTLDQSGTGLLKFTSAFTATGVGSKTLILQGSTAGSGELAGAVVDNSDTNKTSVTKSGTGKWMLSGANTYTGTTTVTGGMLAINGSLGNTATTVAAAATLGGSGTLAGATTIHGTLAPGANETGRLTVNNTLTLAPSSAIAWQVADWTGAAGTGYDTVTATELDLTATAEAGITLTITPASLVNFTDAPKSFTLIQTTGGITGFDPAKFTLVTTGFTSGIGTWSIQQSGNNLVLAYSFSNTAPVFTANPITGGGATEGAAYSGSIAGHVTDPDAGDSKTFVKVSGPSWLEISQIGALSGTPLNGDVGPNSFTVKVTDTAGASATATLNIMVMNVNNAPVFTTNPITGNGATEGVAYSGSIAGYGSDVDAGDSLTYSKVSGPSWLGVSEVGALSGTPSSGDVGSNSFVVRVADASGESATATLNIAVTGFYYNSVWVSPTGGSWLTTGNWSGGVFANGADKTADFSTLNLTANATVALDGARTLGGLTFGDTTPSHNWTLNTGSGGPLTLAVSSGSPVINVANQTATIGTVLAGSQGLAKTGAGTLVLTAANSYSGLTNVSAGTLQLGDGAIQPTINSTYDIASAATLRIQYNTTGSAAQTWSKYTGAGILALKTGKNFDYAWGTPGLGTGFTGTLRIESGRANTSTATGGGLGGTTNIVVKTGGQLGMWNGGTFNQNFTIEGTGYGEGSGYDVALRFANAGLTTTLNGGIALTDSATIGARGTGIGMLNGVISGATPATLTFGTSTLNGNVVLTGNNTYTGNTIIAAGTLEIGGSGKLGSGSYSGTIANAGTFRHASSSNQTLSGVISGAGGLAKLGTATLTLTGANTYTGTTTISGGTLLVDGSLANSATTVAAAGTLGGSGTINGAVTVSGTLAPGTAGIGTLTVNNTLTLAGDSDIAWEISDWTGTAGTGWDKLTVNSLKLTATASNPVTIRLGESVPANFTETSKTFILVQTTGGITGFSADKFVIDDSALTNPQGTWAVQQSGNNLLLAYTRHNTTPAFVSDPTLLGATEDTAFNGSLVANDPDIAESLTFEKLSGPSWLVVSFDGNLSGTPSNSDVGVGNFTVRVIDSMGAEDTATLSITVANVNDAPVFTADPIHLSAPEDSAFAGQLAATDVDAGDSLAFSKISGPAWLVVSNLGALSGTPTNADVGVNTFTVRVRDAAGAFDDATLNITVVNVNDAPVFTVDPIHLSATEDSVFTGQLAATDMDAGDSLAFSKISGPAWLTVSNLGALSGTPTNADVGVNTFTVRVRDAGGAFDESTLNITVANVNDAPVFTVDPILATNAAIGTAYTGQTLAGKANDADAGDTITYSKVSGPAWLVVAQNGDLTGTPPAGSEGLNTFVVRVTDTSSATDEAELRINVGSLPLPWVSADIGTGMLAGSASQSAGIFTLAGSGVIGGFEMADKLQFTYQTLTGDGEIIARVSALQNTGTASRVGVMIRDTLAPNSKRVFFGLGNTGDYSWERRISTGGNNISYSSGSGTVPNTWVRLVRNGSMITAYKSSDGTSWTTVTSGTVVMAANCYIGLAVSSGSNTTLNTSQFSNVSVTP